MSHISFTGLLVSYIKLSALWLLMTAAATATYTNVLSSIPLGLGITAVSVEMPVLVTLVHVATHFMLK